MPATPQDRRPPARKQTASSKARQQNADDEALDQGFALTDGDVRLSVRLRDVRGSHEAALVKETGYDFMGLLEALAQRQGTDLLAAALWFVRLVNDRPSPPYIELLDEVGYADYLERDLDKPEADGAPKASGGN